MDALPNRECPLCGGPNACAPAQTGTLATPCWCRDVVIPPETLARVPEDQRRRACLCAACAAAASHPSQPAG